jgi:CRISPR-associated endonuclease Csn1
VIVDWRLGIDLGTNSLGWWAFTVEKKDNNWKINESLDGGVYIFTDGREPATAGRIGDSNAVERRLARGTRRNRGRGKSRQRALMNELIALGLMPGESEKRKIYFQNLPKEPDRYHPYRLRAEALDRTLTPFELGRALFHLSVRRGFKSNRIEQSEDSGGSLKERIDELNNKLGGRTLGQFLWDQYRKAKEQENSGKLAAGIRFRGESDLYPERSMYQAEFDAIHERQSKHHKLSDEDWERLRDRYILFQWPLKPVERGSCEFFPEFQRHWKDTPIGHDFRIHQELNSLRWFDADMGDHKLDLKQRNFVLDLLLTRKSEVKFSSMRKGKWPDRTPVFPDCIRFNFEDGKRKGFNPHKIGVLLVENPVLGEMWRTRSSDDGDGGLLDDIFEALHQEADPEILEKRLSEAYEISNDATQALMAIPLSRATASVSKHFMEKIVPVLRDQGLLYWDAVKELTDEAGTPLHHSHRPGSGDRDNLPYYGEILRGSMMGSDPAADPATDPEKRYGRINNPTVHVALNSLRRVTNALIKRFGKPPVEIHLELGRDLKQTRQRRDEETSRQGRNQRENERIREDLRRHKIDNPSALDIKKVKLWEELGKSELARLCPFSGRPVSFSQLLNGEAEIEHILPFKRTLDDSTGNLTVAMRWANRLKGNRTPYEAFASGAHETDGIAWETVRARAELLPPNKSWRFGLDAMKQFEGEGDFIARQLTDNAYIARAAQNYLSCLKGVDQVVPNRGGLTAMLRGKWRLNGILSDDNRKNREDHRHHAIDAAVIGLGGRSVLNEVSRLTARAADDRVRIAVPNLDQAIEEAIRKRVPEIIVAFKPDHGWQGAMFKETAYGFVEPAQRDPDFPDHNLVFRKPLMSLSAKECDAIRDRHTRRLVKECLSKAKSSGEKPEKALARLSTETGIKSVRLLVKDQTVKPVPSAPYKGYKPDSYVCCDIWRCPKGKTGRWKKGEFVWQGVYWPYARTANGVPAATEKPHPAARLVTRLFKNDVVAYEDGGVTRIMRVAGFSTTNNKLNLVPHNEANSKQNYISINVIGGKGLRKLHVGPDGGVRGLKQGEKS